MINIATKNNGDRRLGIDRRDLSYTAYLPERRLGKDRRSGFDRRSSQTHERRIHTERRAALAV